MSLMDSEFRKDKTILHTVHNELIEFVSTTCTDDHWLEYLERGICLSAAISQSSKTEFLFSKAVYIRITR